MIIDLGNKDLFKDAPANPKKHLILISVRDGKNSYEICKFLKKISDAFDALVFIEIDQKIESSFQIKIYENPELNSVNVFNLKKEVSKLKAIEPIII